MIDPFLEHAVCMRESFGTGAEPHVLAEVISAFHAVTTGFAHDSRFYGYTLANGDAMNTWSDSGDNSSRLVTKDEGRLNSEVTVSCMKIIVQITTAKASSLTAT